MRRWAESRLSAGVPITEDAAVIEAGLDLDLTASLDLAYNGQLAEYAQNHGVRADLTVGF